MGKVMAWGRATACAVIFAGLSACNGDNTNSSSSSKAQMPAAPTGTSSGQLYSISTAPKNATPQIAGNPDTEVHVGEAYSFTPSASDANGDRLTYSISSKPDWASFNTSTGRLSGTPGSGDIGSYEEIVVSVSDRHSTANLAAFAINVTQPDNGNITLAWQAPTENTDGSPLTNLSGYKIHYGTQSGRYSTTVVVDNAGITRYVIDNLAPGTYYFAITAVSASGTESDLSGEARKQI